MLIEKSLLLLLVELILVIVAKISCPVPPALITYLEIGKIAGGLTPGLIYPVYFSLRRTALQPGKIAFQLLGLSFDHYLHATIRLVACVAVQAKCKCLAASKEPETDPLYIPMHHGA
jgi:hypothetical protein